VSRSSSSQFGHELLFPTGSLSVAKNCANLPSSGSWMHSTQDHAAFARRRWRCDLLISLEEPAQAFELGVRQRIAPLLAEQIGAANG
jgi:hypothetical protein